MRELGLTDPDSGPVAGESRGRVLELLRAAHAAMAVNEVAERVGLHPSTARFHLDGLVDAGLADRLTEDRNRRGRPRTLYIGVAEDPSTGRRSYRLLAQMLTGLVADTLAEPGPAAEAAGEAWGRYLAERPAPSERVDAAEGLRRLSALLAEMGFAPGEVDDGPRPVLPLRHCPFREVAEQHQEVVCSLHLGLIRGLLAEVRAPLTAERLEPLVEPSLCLARLAPARGRPGSPAGRRRPRAGR